VRVEEVDKRGRCGRARWCPCTGAQGGAELLPPDPTAGEVGLLPSWAPDTHSPPPSGPQHRAPPAGHAPQLQCRATMPMA